VGNLSRSAGWLVGCSQPLALHSTH
jgi:hypothetical protein